MSTQPTRDEIANYLSVGYVVFRGILPWSLIRDLRRMAEQIREVTNKVHGSQAQRSDMLASVAQEHEVDLTPLRDYRELEPLNRAIRAVLQTDELVYGDPARTAIFYHPLSHPRAVAWHRDLTPGNTGMDEQDFRRWTCNLRVVNQINCALYDDSSTWYVPGSEMRPDLPEEATAADALVLPAGEKPEDMPFEELEQRHIEYCRQMPRAVCLHLHPGDFAMYRPLGWHLGNYSPHRRRATVHDTVWTAENEAFYRALKAVREAARAKV